MSPDQKSFHVDSSTSTASGRTLSSPDAHRHHPPGAGNIRVLDNKATRRIRGEIACAECRRLKIRCDKTVPCSTCVKRGCAALCPNGTIPPGDGSRFVLAATDHLRKKMMALEARMHSLEDALVIIQANHSDRPHPLLAALDEEEEEEESTLKPVVEESAASALSDSLGALHIDGQGAARFFGPSGGSESLLLTAMDPENKASSNTERLNIQKLDDSYLPQEIRNCYQAFPFAPSGVLPATILPMIEAFLPPIQRAVDLCETFMEHLTWMFQIVTRQQVIKELIPVIYKRNCIPYGLHDLALMLIVLGIGTLVDLKLPPYSLEAQHYYRLARAALALQPVLGEQSVVTIKVLHLMSIYNGMSGKESNLEQSYALLDLASQVAVRIGFHIDPSLWGFVDKEAYDRRVYFWNLMAGVLWQSLVTGRPPALLTTYIDCRLPTAEEEVRFQQDEVPLGFGIWGFRVSVECLIPLVKTTLAVKPPSYQAILELDRKIRDFVKTSDADKSKDGRTATSMAIFVRSHYQALLLMFLHRGFFAQAMTENPLDPLQSPYGQSVLAAYSSACVVLEDTKSQYANKPLLCARIWRIWSLAFSATVIIGTVAIRGIHLNSEPPAFEEFESACAMFRSAAETSSRAARAMPILEVMLQKAHKARENYRQRRSPLVEEIRPDDELSIFGGKTRLVSPPPPLALPSSSKPKPHTHSSEQTPHHPCSMEQRSLRDRILHQDGELSDCYLENFHATFADLSGGWDGLFHEVPQASQALAANVGSPYSVPGSVEGPMLDDRWSAFMHNYNILSETAHPQHSEFSVRSR
ncbi:putative fungal specific transcription factor [Lyophyllum shimeji]|uniref:Fungal specific transcription factor n=1 Tax=Lyophyllum shimeji TaxID=47721 RepID=A0A9P3UIX0_LYOSH|nr:putative fungal specific transcription factor [Lyophyllum shimeji]